MELKSDSKDIKRALSKTCEDVAFIRGKIEANDTLDEQKHNWKQTIFNAVMLIAVTVFGWLALNK